MLTPDEVEEIVRNTKAPPRIVRLFCEYLKTGAFHISPPGHYTVSDGLAIFTKRQRTAEAARLPIYGMRALLLSLAKLPGRLFVRLQLCLTKKSIRSIFTRTFSIPSGMHLSCPHSRRPTKRERRRVRDLKDAILNTTWMLNRVINGAKDEARRRQLTSALHGIALNPSADSETKERAAGFLARLEN
jgi:hypothetical protein